ncbi:STAS domain-containing protein [Dactylosporangium aurantiacum]|uniref:STAS domain-containing protein n=1 Tax=Dactylosporangium aurantiacum TaxID=35754 RepID=A0A9Q9IP62_9ACTN|nr:STAS domain-containing protein [Dactylosporangium aurantiacum]MDG6110337.1 STAS domain-containing protein [Dactylosporangium aurantiacum]UWZ58623.1 STAS domain-containing protein [Dactylosporangium aurantiacum]
MSFSIDVRARLTGAAAIVVRGDLDAASVGRLIAAVDEVLRGRPGRLCIDLGLVTFADSVAVGALVHVQRRCTQVGCRLFVERLSPVLDRTLTVAGVLHLFTVTGG